MRRALSVLLVAAFPGCLVYAQLPDESACEIYVKTRYFPIILNHELRPYQRDTRQPYDLLAATHVYAPPNTSYTVLQEPAPMAGWKMEWTALNNDSTLRRLRISPDAPAGIGQIEFQEGYHAWAEGCDSEARFLPRGWTLDPPILGATADVGKGVWVHTVGFFPNGTVFYSTTRDFLANEWPYSEGVNDPRETKPLKVYVYDRSRAERPEYWNASIDPFDGENNLNAAYVTTIEGFNEGLKGLSSATSRIVVVPPEKAYTVPGREQHWLYGETLIFWIKITRIVDLPCEENIDYVTDRPFVPDACRPSALSDT